MLFLQSSGREPRWEQQPLLPTQPLSPPGMALIPDPQPRGPHPVLVDLSFSEVASLALGLYHSRVDTGVLSSMLGPNPLGVVSPPTVTATDGPSFTQCPLGAESPPCENPCSRFYPGFDNRVGPAVESLSHEQSFG